MLPRWLCRAGAWFADAVRSLALLPKQLRQTGARLRVGLLVYRGQVFLQRAERNAHSLGELFEHIFAADDQRNGITFAGRQVVALGERGKAVFETVFLAVFRCLLLGRRLLLCFRFRLTLFCFAGEPVTVFSAGGSSFPCIAFVPCGTYRFGVLLRTAEPCRDAAPAVVCHHVQVVRPGRWHRLAMKCRECANRACPKRRAGR